MHQDVDSATTLRWPWQLQPRVPGDAENVGSQFLSLRQFFRVQHSPPLPSAHKSPITTRFAQKPPHCDKPAETRISLSPALCLQSGDCCCGAVTTGIDPIPPRKLSSSEFLPLAGAFRPHIDGPTEMLNAMGAISLVNDRPA